MFKDPAEIKALIEWARSQKLKRLKVGDVEFEISELAYVDDITAGTDLSVAPPKDLSNGTIRADEDEDILFHSARG